MYFGKPTYKKANAAPTTHKRATQPHPPDLHGSGNKRNKTVAAPGLKQNPNKSRAPSKNTQAYHGSAYANRFTPPQRRDRYQTQQKMSDQKGLNTPCQSPLKPHKTPSDL